MRGFAGRQVARFPGIGNIAWQWPLNDLLSRYPVTKRLCAGICMWRTGLSTAGWASARSSHGWRMGRQEPLAEMASND